MEGAGEGRGGRVCDAGRRLCWQESDYFTPQGEFRVDAGGSKVLLNCLMYKLSYYRFGELQVSNGGWSRIHSHSSSSDLIGRLHVSDVPSHLIGCVYVSHVPSDLIGCVCVSHVPSNLIGCILELGQMVSISKCRGTTRHRPSNVHSTEVSTDNRMVHF